MYKTFKNIKTLKMSVNRVSHSKYNQIFNNLTEMYMST